MFFYLLRLFETKIIIFNFQYFSSFLIDFWRGPDRLEEHTGFEPAIPAWEAGVLPLHQCSVMPAPSAIGGPPLRADGLYYDRRLRRPLRRWRAGPDSNRLPLAVLRVCFRKHLPPVSPPLGRQRKGSFKPSQPYSGSAHRIRRRGNYWGRAFSALRPPPLRWLHMDRLPSPKR